jgi:hypothetical protein
MRIEAGSDTTVGVPIVQVAGFPGQIKGVQWPAIWTPMQLRFRVVGRSTQKAGVSDGPARTTGNSDAGSVGSALPRDRLVRPTASVQPKRAMICGELKLSSVPVRR